ncbi:MAG: nucleotide exchange factor GrpE [Methyloprofundus sp.]|nr:nucleotide exchange factor GrpE [Methyloprofundus sp.]
MTTDIQKTALLEDFQKYLQQDQLKLLTADEQPDMNTLLAELTALKTEVKAQSRQFKNTLDTLSSALDMAQDHNKMLATELLGQAEKQEQQHAEFMRLMLLEMVDLYDRLANGATVLQNYQPINALFNHSKKKDVRFIERFKEGQLMTIKRFEQLLHSHQVREIECVGELLDPLTMTAIETDDNPKYLNGIVLEELRKGFLYQDQVLRLAEVKVNKTKAG